VTLEVNTQISITLVGSESLNDMLFGTSAADTLVGLGGNDTLFGREGDDALIGGAGDDTYVVGSASDSVLEFAPDGRDRVESTATSYTLPDHVEDLTLAGFGSNNGTGNAEINRIIGNAGNNTLNGGAGGDTVNAGMGNDIVIGGGGADTLLGGWGNDVLRGVSAADVLTGGEGADLFDFDAVGHSGTTVRTRDRITDFNSGQGDRIDLSTIDANGTGAGNGAFTFIGSANFSGNATGKLRFDAGRHLLLGSTDADTAAEFSIRLSGVDNMTGGNFIL
jgi:Ca2+-binding RTX toxin-like protein